MPRREPERGGWNNPEGSRKEGALPNGVEVTKLWQQRASLEGQSEAVSGLDTNLCFIFPIRMFWTLCGRLNAVVTRSLASQFGYRPHSPNPPLTCPAILQNRWSGTNGWWSESKGMIKSHGEHTFSISSRTHTDCTPTYKTISTLWITHWCIVICFKTRSCSLACTLTSWGLMLPSSGAWPRETQCGQTSTTLSGWVVRAQIFSKKLINEINIYCCEFLKFPCIPFCHLEPIFIDAHLIPDGTDPNDAKLYFFFRERLTDNSGNTKNIHTMVARVCPVSAFVFAWIDCHSWK